MLLFLVWTIVYQGIVITKKKHPDKGTTDELDDTKYSVNITNFVWDYTAMQPTVFCVLMV